MNLPNISARLALDSRKGDLSIFSPALNLSGKILLVTAGYYLAGLIGLQLKLAPFGISIIWPPNAVLLAALMLIPVRMWWCYLLPLLPAHLHLVTLFQNSQIPLPAMLGQFVANTSQAALAALAVRPLIGFPPRLGTLREMVRFISLAAIAAPAVASMMAAYAFVLTGWADDFWLTWRMRFLTNVFATLTFTPVIVLTVLGGTPILRNVSPLRCAEFAMLMTALFAIGIPVFGMETAGPKSYPALLYAPVPLLLWAATRFGLRPLCLVLLATALLSLASAIAGRGPFATNSAEGNVTQLQLYLVAISVPLLFLCTVLEERRGAVEALRRSEADARTQLGQLSAIYQAVPTGLAFLDTNLRFISINDYLAEINGIPAAAHIGRTLRQVLGDLAKQVEPLYRHVIDTGQPMPDIEVRSKEPGPWAGRVWLVNYQPVKDEHGTVVGVSTTVHEITARKQAEEVLRNIAAGVSAKTGENFFRSLAQHISEALQVEYTFVCELMENGSQARTVASYANGAEIENIQYDLADTPCEQVLRHGTYSCPRDVKQVFARDVLLQSMDVQGYLGVCLKDSAGKPLGLLAVMSQKPLIKMEPTQSMLDIFASRAAAELERKQAEDRLRLREQELSVSEERYREVVESQTDLVCRYLGDGTLTFVNEAYCRFFGLPREKLIGRKFFDFIPENARAAAAENLARLTAERQAHSVEHEVLRPDGAIAWQHWVDYAIFGPRGEIIEFQGIGRDITDRKRAEEANQKLAHASRLAMVGELAAIIAHELSQPLSAMLTNTDAAELLLQDSNRPGLDELRVIVADIRKDNRRAAACVGQMRTLLRNQQLEFSPLDLNELLAGILHFVELEARRCRIQIETHCSLHPLIVRGDRVHLEQVFLNLMLNGMQAMAAVPESERRLDIHLDTRDGTVQFAVCDTGHGIPPDRLPRIFEAFYTTKKEGMGLGLYIAKSIVEAHFGHIRAENNPTGGATFHVTLPIDKKRDEAILIPPS